MTYKGWDFGQKREPSAWITFLMQRILKRSQSPEFAIAPHNQNNER